MWLEYDVKMSGENARGTPYYTGLRYRAGPAGKVDSLYSLLFTVPPVTIGWTMPEPASRGQ